MADKRFTGGAYQIDDLRGRFQTVATDDQYQVFFNMKGALVDIAKDLGMDYRFLIEDLGLYVADAVLPGSSFADVEISGDRQGITERNPFQRIYDDVTFSFYVDRNYQVLRFFEAWIQYINPLVSNTRGIAANQVMRFSYPDNYKGEMIITKFNKDLTARSKNYGFGNSLVDYLDQLSYRFFRVWPYSLASTPVSYQGQSLLRVNVTFRYDRYIVSEVTRPVQPPRGGRIRYSAYGTEDYSFGSQKDNNTTTSNNTIAGTNVDDMGKGFYNVNTQKGDGWSWSNLNPWNWNWKFEKPSNWNIKDSTKPK